MGDQLLRQGDTAVLDALADIEVNTMRPLLHIYLGLSTVGKRAFCGHVCPKTTFPPIPYRPSIRHCAECHRIAKREGWSV